MKAASAIKSETAFFRLNYNLPFISFYSCVQHAFVF